MKMLSVFIVFAVLVGAANGQSQAWMPDQPTISTMEANLSMPAGARALSEYARIYAGQMLNGHRLIQAEYVNPSLLQATADAPSQNLQKVNPQLLLIIRRHSAGAYVVADSSQFPGYMDGGCSIIHFSYDVDAKHVEHIACNGNA